MSLIAQRREKIRRRLAKEGVDALLVTDFTNVSYLSGFTGDDSYLLVTKKRDYVISDERYTTQLEEECPELELTIRGPGTKMLPFVSSLLSKQKVTLLGVEAGSMTIDFYADLAGAVKGCQLEPVRGWVEQLRMIKDREEIARTRVACDQARRAFEVVRAALTRDMTELQVAADLEYQARRFGAIGMSFPPIVAVGARAALPHASPTTQQLGAADFTLIDWGVNEGLYVSDLTRILVTGKISPKLRKVYGVVLDAQLAAIEAIRPGVRCEAVDSVARKIIGKAGYGKRFGHGLGHGTGLNIHEAPRLSQGQSTVLKPGMIVTVEPGIYLPGWGGVRIEDDILVTRTGHEVLTSVPKQLEECLVG
ncbi:MAG: aminopeptidase P family protein [Planctomycetales bacterium]|nr:aminopeptidase P family protein [Planctomycetales bacterium]